MKKFALISLTFSITLWANNAINSPMVLPSTGKVTVLQPQSDKELLWVDEQIKAIIPSRVGVPDGFINSLLDPMKYLTPVRLTNNSGSTLLAPPKLGCISLLPAIPKVIEEPLRLQALMNKSALINGKWYKLNDTVRNYSLAEVKQSSVLLNGKKGQPLILFLNKLNNNITINTK
ncbi:MAG: hypothetical protein PHQ22_05800 [Sulfuricurvum sp.]|nr:hypothetical protein [Sulfuricurvum sp.]MDD5386690.1 hypothetical protein [Sulfuricurvum sp.]